MKKLIVFLILLGLAVPAQALNQYDGSSFTNVSQLWNPSYTYATQYSTMRQELVQQENFYSRNWAARYSWLDVATGTQLATTTRFWGYTIPMSPASAPTNQAGASSPNTGDMIRISNSAVGVKLANTSLTTTGGAGVERASVWWYCNGDNGSGLNNWNPDSQWWDGAQMRVTFGETDQSQYSLVDDDANPATPMVPVFPETDSLTQGYHRVYLSGAGYAMPLSVEDSAENVIGGDAYSVAYGKWQKLVIDCDIPGGTFSLDILDTDGVTSVLAAPITGALPAGMTKFNALGFRSYPYEGRPNDFWFDEIAWETSGDVIPEPATMILLSLGGLLLRRRK